MLIVGIVFFHLAVRKVRRSQSLLVLGVVGLALGYCFLLYYGAQIALGMIFILLLLSGSKGDGLAF